MNPLLEISKAFMLKFQDAYFDEGQTGFFFFEPIFELSFLLLHPRIFLSPFGFGWTPNPAASTWSVRSTDR